MNSFFIVIFCTGVSNFAEAYAYPHHLPTTSDDSFFYKGYEAYRNGHLNEAVDNFLQHRRRFANSKHVEFIFYTLGSIYFAIDKYDKAVVYWDSLNKIFPNSEYKISALIGIGDAHFKMKNYQYALKIYRTVKMLSPSNVILQEINLKIEEALYYLGRHPSLIDALHRFIETNADTTKEGGLIARTILRIAKIYAEKKEYYSALAEIEKLENMYPASSIIAEALFEKVNIYKLLGDNRKRKQILLLIFAKKEAEDFYIYSVVELANLYLNEQKYDSAFYYFDRLRTNEKYKDVALIEIARIYHTLGRNDEALVVINSLIKDCPHSKFIYDAYMLEVNIIKNQGDLQQAINTLKELQEKIGTKPEIFLELGNISFEMHDYLSALGNYLKASESFKDRRDESARALIQAGDAAYAMGDKLNARRYYLNASLIAQSSTVKNEAVLKIRNLD